MTEERAPHTQEPAEGAEENVPTPGAERSDEGDGPNGGSGAEEGAAQHPQEPAEGGEDEVEG